LFALVRDGVVTYEDAMEIASRPQDLTVQLREGGVLA
jgi:twitching motility protein PilT